MTAISKFFQVTNQLLLEYKSDKYKSTVKYAESGDTDCNFIMYQGDNGLQYCIDMENIKYWKFPDSGSNTYYYPGRFVEQSDLDISDTDEEVYGRYLDLVRDNVVDYYTLLYREEEQCTSIVHGYFGEV